MLKVGLKDNDSFQTKLHKIKRANLIQSWTVTEKTKVQYLIWKFISVFRYVSSCNIYNFFLETAFDQQVMDKIKPMRYI